MNLFKSIALLTIGLLAIAPPALAKNKSSGSLLVGCLTADTVLQGWEGLGTGAPAAMVTISPANLWPPNHKFEDVLLSLSLSADSTSAVAVSLTVEETEDGITHDQVAGDDAGGHGCGAPTVKQGADWAPTVFSSLTEDATLQFLSDSPLLLGGIQLRRERCAKDGTRMYAISVICRDVTNGVSDTVILNVTVPKSRSTGP